MPALCWGEEKGKGRKKKKETKEKRGKEGGVVRPAETRARDRKLGR